MPPDNQLDKGTAVPIASGVSLENRAIRVSQAAFHWGETKLMSDVTDGTRLERAVRIAADVAIVVVAVVVVTVAFRNRHLLFRERPPAPIAVGETLAIEGLDFSRHHQTYLLVISTRCGFCNESAGFYRQLTAAASRRSGVAVVAALPQPVAESRAYLDGLEVPIDDVLQVKPPTIGVRGTPTILLADSQGVVRRVWNAKLDPAREQEVLKSIHSSRQGGNDEAAAQRYSRKIAGARDSSRGTLRP